MKHLACRIVGPGELNYAIYTLLLRYINNKGMNYATLNEADGTLGSVSKELYRRLIQPYEDEKIEKNGDIYIN